MRPLLIVSVVLISVVLIAPRPAFATPSLAKAALALCRCDETHDPREVLEGAGQRAVAPLLDAMSSRTCDDDCAGEAFDLLVESLCEAQVRREGRGVTAALAPLRAALESDDPRRADAALDVLVELASVHESHGNLETTWPSTTRHRCSEGRALVVTAAPSIARMLARAKGKRLAKVLTSLEALKLGDAGAPLVPALTRALDSEREWERAARLLATYGGAAAPAASRIGRRLAATTDLLPERTLAWTMAAIGAPSPTAAAALPPRLDESVTHLCDAGLKRFPVLFRAAVASGPPRGTAPGPWQAQMTTRARAALERLARCPQPTVERDLLVALTKLPPDNERRSLLEAEMTSATASTARRLWAAWALREYGATLSPTLTTVQASLLGPDDRTPRAAPQAEPDAPELTNDDHTPAINDAKPTVAACHALHPMRGFAIVRLDVALGRVTTARVTGELARTPIGDCVAHALEAAHFPLARATTTELRFQLGP